MPCHTELKSESAHYDKNNDSVYNLHMLEDTCLEADMDYGQHRMKPEEQAIKFKFWYSCYKDLRQSAFH